MKAQVVFLIAALFAPTMKAERLPPDLAAAVRAYDMAQIDGNNRELERLISDHYLLINTRGETETKQQLIADYTAPGFHLKPFKVELPVTRVWESGAVVGGVVTLEGSDVGGPYKIRIRFTDVWAKNGGRWRVIYTHASEEPNR